MSEMHSLFPFIFFSLVFPYLLRPSVPSITPLRYHENFIVPSISNADVRSMTTSSTTAQTDTNECGWSTSSTSGCTRKPLGQTQAEQTRELGKRVRELDQSLTTVDKTTEAANIIKAQRQDASNEHQEAAMEAHARAKNLAELERWMISEAWPFVTMEGDIFQHTRSNASQVSRGNMHQAMVDNVSNEVKAIPSDRKHLNNAINAAIELHANKQKIFIKLARRYYHDLEGYTKDKVDKHQVRIEFDQQFYSDRAQAMREAAIVELQYQDLKKRREFEGERKLEDMYSNYGTLSEDGHVSSMGTFHLRAVRGAYALDQPYVEEYLNNIDQNHLLSPTCPPTVPKSANDSDFVARSVNVGDFDTFSRADDHRTAERIQRRRGETEVVRGQVQSGSAQQA